MPDFDVALCTTEQFDVETTDDWYVANILEEDRLLAEALRARGLSSRRVAWSRPGLDLAGTLVLLRTTWDWFDRFAEFRRFVSEVARVGQVVNGADLVAWNLDKHYLLDLERAGVRVVPTVIAEAGDARSLAELVSQLPESFAGELVYKPVVSAAGRETVRFSPADIATVADRFAELLSSESMMLQPFQASVPAAGELSLVVLGGRHSHAVRKTARPGEFRVQDDHGGKVAPWAATADEVAFAERAVAACHPLPAYARVDVVRDNTGALAVMELEVVEPELFFRFHPPSAERLADLVAEIHRDWHTSR